MKYEVQNTKNYYDTNAHNYSSSYDLSGDNYPANYYRLEVVKKIISKYKLSGKVLDAGCGTGELLSHLCMNGFDATGCDLSSGMLREAKNLVHKTSGKEIPFFETNLNDLSMFEDNSFDHVFSLGVLPYIPEEEEAICYQEISRVLKPEGFFISAHENELFDTFTFNRYTMRFFERNIYPVLEKNNSSPSLNECKDMLKDLIPNHEKPVNKNPDKSARDIIFLKPENPLVLPEKLKEFEFAHQERHFYHFHALPPLIRNGSQQLMELSKTLEVESSEDWQGLFMASTFIEVSKKNN
jgi:ubiquinone/menaquinone biosynthesis C-methylase UbiE